MAKLRLKSVVGGKKSFSPVDMDYTQQIRSQMDDIISNFRTIQGAVPGLGVHALQHALSPIYDTSQELVPVDTGKLKASGYIEVQQEGSELTGNVGYARDNDPFYAVIVHERLDLRHEPPTQAKFLEEAINRHIDEIPERFAEYMREALGME
jgi:hypothetical protein